MGWGRQVREYSFFPLLLNSLLPPTPSENILEDVCLENMNRAGEVDRGGGIGINMKVKHQQMLVFIIFQGGY